MKSAKTITILSPQIVGINFPRVILPVSLIKMTLENIVLILVSGKMYILIYTRIHSSESLVEMGRRENIVDKKEKKNKKVRSNLHIRSSELEYSHSTRAKK